MSSAALRSCVLSGLLASLVQCVHHTPTDASTPTPARVLPPKLVVLVVIDQLPSWTFDAQQRALDGGIARLVREGVYYPRALYPYAGTHTAPGHATIGTGVPPSVHGIVANRWLDAASGKVVEVDDDASAPVLDPRGGPQRAYGISNAHLEADGLAETLHAARPGAQAIAIGLKGRASGHVLGRQPDLALWFDPDSGALTSSTRFVRTLPAWVTAFAQAHPRAELLAQQWRADDPERLARLAEGPDDRPGEGDPYGLGAVYPHDLAKASDAGKAFSFTPMANTLLVDAAIAAIGGAQLGQDDVPDLLAVTFSAHDYAGHVWCQESWERVDHLLGIDRDLGRLLDALDREVGEGRYAVVLTSDHGSTPARDPKASGKLVLTDELAAAATRATDIALGPGTWIAGAGVLGVSTTPAFDALDETRHTAALTAILAALRALPGVGYAEATADVLGDCDRRDGVAALVCRSNFAGRTPSIYVAAADGVLLNDETRECTAHGSPNPYDREVPVIVLAPGQLPRRDTHEVSMLQLAPTVAALLGVPAPAQATDASLVPAAGSGP